MKEIISKSLKISLPILLVVYILFPYLLTRTNIWSISYETTGQIGDTFGGISGPIIAFLGVLTTFWAFYIQYETNNIQREQFENQQLDLKIERFENRYFELIKFHRENIAEVGGRKVFVSLLREFRAALTITKELCDSSNVTLSQQKIADIAYLSFYYGTGLNSTRILKSALSNYPEEITTPLIKKLESKEIKEQFQADLGFSPFGGNQSRLAHYFQHLYQTVKYVDTQVLNINKYEYMKLLRAQLSTHEEALFMFNTISNLGASWEKEELITKYRLIKHIPKDFFNSETEIDVKSIFPKLQFKWEETN